MTKFGTTGICLCMILLSGCDNTFSPNGMYSEKMVVYAIFTTASDTQIVRVYGTYPSLSSAAETEISDAQVTLTKGDSTFTFRDTTLERTDTSRYRTRVKAFVGYRIRLEPGARYQLLVVSGSRGSATAGAVALYPGRVIVRNDVPGNFQVGVVLGQNTRAYLLRMFLEYDLLVDTTRVIRTVEIPRAVDGTTGEFYYPTPNSNEIGSVIFSADGFNRVVARLRQEFPGSNLHLRRTIYRLTELDDAIYAYYSTVNGFPDSGTLRLDEPDYTNITGGLGIFAMTSQTVSYADTAGN